MVPLAGMAQLLDLVVVKFMEEILILIVLALARDMEIELMVPYMVVMAVARVTEAVRMVVVLLQQGTIRTKSERIFFLLFFFFITGHQIPSLLFDMKIFYAKLGLGCFQKTAEYSVAANLII